MKLTLQQHHKSMSMMGLGALFASLLPMISLISSEVPVFTMLTLAGGIASLIHLPFITKSDRGFFVQKYFFLHAIFGGIFVTLGYSLFTLSIRDSINPFVPTLIFEMYPIGIILLSNIFLNKENTSLKQFLWVILAAIGVIIMMLDTHNNQLNITFNSSFYLSILSLALLSFGAVIISRAFKTKKSNLHHAILASFYARLSGVFITGIFAFYESVELETLTQNWWPITLYGVFVLGLTNICYYIAIHFSKTHLVNTVWYLTPALGILWLWLFSYGALSAFILLGASLIIIANIKLCFEQS